MRTRIGIQFVAVVGVVIAVAITVLAMLTLRSHRREMIAQLTRSADLLSETVKRSTEDYMLENRRERVLRQIEAIGRDERIDRVRLFNKEGRIVFSSDAAEVGRLPEPGSEACVGCDQGQPPLDERTRIFTVGARRLLGIANPIQNQPSCSAAACHAHPPDETVLGVLDVTMRLDDVDQQIAASRRRIAALAVVTIAVTGLLLWVLSRRLIVRPVEALAAGTRRVAAGDLTTTIAVTGRHELGELASAFNAMTARLSDDQRQLAQADKLASVGRLAAGVAHEINNPLTGVLSYASLLAERPGLNPEMRADLEVVVRETKRCREIVRGLLDFARQTPPRRQPTDLNDVARRAVAVVMNQLQLRHVSLALDLAADLPAVDADANQMQQVLVNLLLNATDAIGERGGTIRLASRRSELPPRGHELIRRAVCPAGCDLLDATSRVGGSPRIRVVWTHGDREWTVCLDPVYGRFNHLSAEPCPEGVVALVACPRCRASLACPDHPCPDCGAPTFAVRGVADEPIHLCTRTGCHYTWWEARERRGAAPIAELAVEDDGRGIPRDALAKLFEPFFTTKGVRGTGLGLAITWGIVEGHGGTIDVESEEGKGTRVTVRLPVAASDQKRVAA
ncbi:MAG TPA: ATP-binding protein [Candidatus Eisenbacteria bacterium]|nr:ATP-binding protein [Candidatus Eisenbacteria bacterium]